MPFDSRKTVVGTERIAEALLFSRCTEVRVASVMTDREEPDIYLSSDNNRR